MTSIEPAVKRAIMALLKRGAISVQQAADLACVSRQAINLWVVKEGWDMKLRQDAFAAREFAKLMGTNLNRQKSKRELRQDAEAAQEMWEWRNAQDGLGSSPTRPSH